MLRKLSAAYRASGSPRDKDRLRDEAARLVHQGWLEGRFGRAADVATVTGWSRQHAARLGKKNGPLHASPAFSQLRQLAEPALRLREASSSARSAMKQEAMRIAREGTVQGVYGQVAAVARVVGWTREHVARMAAEEDEETGAG